MIGLSRVGKHLSAISSNSQINQPQLIHKSVELRSSSLVQLNVDCNKYRPVLRSWNVDEIRRQRSDGPRLKIEPFGKINRKIPGCELGKGQLSELENRAKN